jgi:DNA-binding MarR family transcriptional regulator
MIQFDSPSQKLVLDHLKNFIKVHQYAPTLKETAKDLRMSIKTVRIQREKLKEMGLITITPGSQRGVRLGGSSD